MTNKVEKKNVNVLSTKTAVKYRNIVSLIIAYYTVVEYQSNLL